MSDLTVIFRNKSHRINIDPSKKVIDLKIIASERTGILTNRFSLQIGEIRLMDNKLIQYYVAYGTEFTMVDVRIEITVTLNDRNYSCNVGELSLIGQFANDLIRLANLETELSIYYNNERLPNTGTILSCGIPNNATLTTVNGAPIKDAIRNITVSYREKSYSIKIEKSKKVVELKKAVSKLTGITVENFCLKFKQIFLLDSKEISVYDGNTFTMENVTINVIVIFKGTEYPFFVNEMTKIDEFRTKIMVKPGSQSFYFNNNILRGTDTIVGCGIENNSVVMVFNEDEAISGKQTLTVTYRQESYLFEIDISNTVLKLKEMVSVKFDKESKNFSLKFYWILLNDAHPISNYVKFGTKFIMSNVVIHVTVRLENLSYGFDVNENITVGELRMMINDKSKKNATHFHYQGSVLELTDSLYESEIEDGGVILATSTLIGGNI